MPFLNPQSDIAFKKLFGDMAHKRIVISFLNSVLGRTGQDEIVDVVMNDPNNFPETTQSKTSIVDVRCTDQQGNQYIVEMQVIPQEYYAVRAQYYSSLAFSRQLAMREKYYKLMPVIFVGVLNFNLFKTKHYISHHFILDNETHDHELKHLEFHFIELTKFKKEEKELFDLVIYLLKNAENIHTVPQVLKEPALQEAFDVLAQANWSIKELEAYDRYLDAYRSSEGQIETAEKRGKHLKAIEIAQNFLDILDVATIAKKTGLTVEQVEELKKNQK
jgi:predicted transposase/invertase (TIGR01784 family)